MGCSVKQKEHSDKILSLSFLGAEFCGLNYKHSGKGEISVVSGDD